MAHHFRCPSVNCQTWFISFPHSIQKIGHCTYFMQMIFIAHRTTNFIDEVIDPKISRVYVQIIYESFKRMQILADILDDFQVQVTTYGESDR